MKLFKRERYLSKIRGFYHECDIIKVISGVRRCGKSSLMEIIADEISSSGVPSENIIYLNLDKKGLKGIRSSDQLESLIDERIKNVKGIKYLFIDEIQNVDGFEVLINSYREEGDYSIFITGLNSYLLSGELVTKLTGRYIEFEIFTLTFEEYIAMKKFYGFDVSPDLLVELNNYVNEGGFPRTVRLDNLADKRTYVSGIVEEIFKKDIKKRVTIRRKASFDLVVNFMVNNYGCLMSVNNIFEGLKKGGNEITRRTIAKYIQCMVDAKLLYECNRFDMKSKKSLSGEKKYYLADLSLSYASNPDSRINYGPALENIVFHYAKSMGYTVSVGRIGALECDFLLKDQDLNYSYVQVSYTILASRETEDREYTPLEKIKDNYPKYVLTTDRLIQKRNGINHENLMDFMVNGKRF